MRKRVGVAAGALVLVAGSFAVVGVLSPGGADPGDLPSATSVVSTRTREPVPEAPVNGGWQVVLDPQARLSYEVPGEWVLAEDDQSLESSSGVRLGRLADYGTYSCQGAEYGRAFSGSGVAEGTPDRAASELAAAIAADQYSDASQTARVTVSRATPVVRDGARGVLVRAEAESAEPGDQCVGLRGTVTVVALTTPAGTGVVVVAADTEAGRAQGPEPVAPEDLKRITDSVRPRR
ncbi:hypothetical protein ACOBQX_27095 [Actinokineospora sp. G85]|uniref:hypothetical protein n=1 Tax=Actinokineospora sp. G85 TaxID=3406626 RepID=UPI003C73F0D8